MEEFASTIADESAAEHNRSLDSFLAFEKNYYRHHFGLWFATLVGPLVVTTTVLGVLYFLTTPAYCWRLVHAACWSFVLLGRFTILTSGSLGIPATHLYWMVTYQDVMVALVFAFHIGFIYRLPWLGPRIAELSVDSEFILDHQPWMKRLTFLGLLAFVAFPLSATGSVGAAIFGRLLGLSRWAIFWGSAIGAVLGNTAMLFLNQSLVALFPQMQEDPIIKWGGIPIVLLIILILERRYRRMKKAYLSSKPRPPATAEPKGRC